MTREEELKQAEEELYQALKIVTASKSLPLTRQVSPPVTNEVETPPTQKLATKYNTGYNKPKETYTPPKQTYAVEKARKTGAVIKETKVPKKVTKPKTPTPPAYSLPLERKVSPQVTDEVKIPFVGKGAQNPPAYSLPLIEGGVTVGDGGRDNQNLRMRENANEVSSQPFIKKAPTLNLPNLDERNFAKGLLGKESEEAAYTKAYLKGLTDSGILESAKTEEELFKEGISGIDEPPKYRFKNPITAPKHQIDNFAKTRDTTSAPTTSQPTTETTSDNRDPDVKLMAAPMVDYTKEWRAAQDEKPELKWEAGTTKKVETETPGLIDTIEGFKNLYDFEKISEDLLQNLEQSAKTSANVSRNTGSPMLVRQAQEIFGKSTVNNTPKTGGKSIGVSARVGLGIEVVRSISDAKKHMEQGKNISEAVGRSAYNTVGRAAFSYAFTVGLAKGGMYIGGLFGGLPGAAIGGFIGGAAGILVDYMYADDFGDFVEEQKFNVEQDPKMVFS
ncbi:MAG: hypothetical protein IKU25_03460 [Clostridia bacterium]|nr:hypothetical protein [Clostridia bacterium]